MFQIKYLEISVLNNPFELDSQINQTTSENLMKEKFPN